MATRAENELKKLERGIKASTEEQDRIVGLVLEIDGKIDAARAAASLIAKEVADEQKQVDYLGGLDAIGKLPAERVGDFDKFKKRVAELIGLRHDLPSIEDLIERKRLINIALQAEMQNSKKLEQAYPDAVEAVNLERCERELANFMALSGQVRESVVKLAILDRELGGNKVLGIHSPLVMPMPLIEPYRSQAEALSHHKHDLFEIPPRFYAIRCAFQNEIKEATGYDINTDLSAR